MSAETKLSFRLRPHLWTLFVRTLVLALPSPSLHSRLRCWCEPALRFSPLFVIETNTAYHRLRFYATIGVFSSREHCVSAAINHIIYGASSQRLLSVLQTLFIVHNTYCVKCSLSHRADYAGTCPKRPLIIWLIRR